MTSLREHHTPSAPESTVNKPAPRNMTDATPASDDRTQLTLRLDDDVVTQEQEDPQEKPDDHHQQPGPDGHVQEEDQDQDTQPPLPKRTEEETDEELAEQGLYRCSTCGNIWDGCSQCNCWQ